MSKIRAFFNKILSLLGIGAKMTESIDSSQNPIPINPSPAPAPEETALEPHPSANILADFTRRALVISSSFEGSDPWANITGDFDGAGLTCGALGWTIKWNNQDPLVQAFVSRYGLPELLKLMPNKGQEYWDLIQADTASDVSLAEQWSRGSNVFQPYLNELRWFWKDPRMQDIQLEYAEKDMGNFAMIQAAKCANYFGLHSVQFHHFAYWFDQAVLNGTGKTPDIAAAASLPIDAVWNWMDVVTDGWLIEDFKRNLKLWREISTKADANDLYLLKLAMLRAKESSRRGMSLTMCRRGTLALGRGYVNDELRSFDF